MNERDKANFNRYLDNLLVEAKVEASMSSFTRTINEIVSQTEFDTDKQAFLLISIDNADSPNPDSYSGFVGDINGYRLLLQAMTLAMNELKRRISEGNEE